MAQATLPSLLGTRYGYRVSDSPGLGAQCGRSTVLGRRTSVTAIDLWRALSDPAIAPVLVFRRLSGSYPSAWAGR
jgi:hypothetical protein